MNLVSLESLLNLLLQNAKISILSKVDKMYLLLYWVTYTKLYVCASTEENSKIVNKKASQLVS